MTRSTLSQEKLSSSNMDQKSGNSCVSTKHGFSCRGGSTIWTFMDSAICNSIHRRAEPASAAGVPGLRPVLRRGALPLRLRHPLRRARQALAQDRDLLRPDAQPRRLLHQEPPLHDLHHAQEERARAKQGLLRPLRVLGELRPDRLHPARRRAHPGHRVRPEDPEQEGQRGARLLAKLPLPISGIFTLNR